MLSGAAYCLALPIGGLLFFKKVLGKICYCIQCKYGTLETMIEWIQTSYTFKHKLTRANDTNFNLPSTRSTILLHYVATSFRTESESDAGKKTQIQCCSEQYVTYGFSQRHH